VALPASNPWVTFSFTTPRRVILATQHLLDKLAVADTQVSRLNELGEWRVSAHPKMLFIRFLSLCLFVNALGASSRAQAQIHCVELGGGSQMCLDIRGDVDWMACEVDGCSYVWEPAALSHLKILDNAIVEETSLVAGFQNPETDSTRTDLAAQHRTALAELEAFRSNLQAAIKPERETR
jgi:hypothetical protein